MMTLQIVRGYNPNPLGKQRDICKHNIYAIYLCVCVCGYICIYGTQNTHKHTYNLFWWNGNNKCCFFIFLKKYTIILTKEKNQQFCTSRNFFWKFSCLRNISAWYSLNLIVNSTVLIVLNKIFFHLYLSSLLFLMYGNDKEDARLGVSSKWTVLWVFFLEAIY